MVFIYNYKCNFYLRAFQIKSYLYKRALSSFTNYNCELLTCKKDLLQILTLILESREIVSMVWDALKNLTAQLFLHIELHGQKIF